MNALSRTHLFPCLGILLILSLTACGTEDPVGLLDAGGIDVVEEDTADGSGADTSEDVAEPDVSEDVLPDDDTYEDVAPGDVVITDTGRDEDVEEAECRFTADCPTNYECESGECVLHCVRDSECDDLNICTSNTCVDSVCVAEVISPAPVIADDVTGDCRRQRCVDGRLSAFPERSDAPADDGIFCTVETCRGTFGVSDPDDSLCDDGNSTNGAETCSVAAGGCILGGQPDWYCAPLLEEWEPTETCGDGQDNDGDGLADENCSCEFGSVQRCYTGAVASRTVGGCLDGYQRCVDRDRPRWGACEGQIVPAEEICDLKDNDCNGCVDDLAECDPLLSCPSEDFARPLRDYALDAASILDLDEVAIESVRWTINSPANSSTVAADNPTAAATNIYLDVSGDYQIGLQVETDKGTLGCSWVVHVAGAGLRVEMRWNTFGSVDMDLHLHRSGSTTNFCTDDDCYYANCRNTGAGRPWGYPPSPGSECGSTGTCVNPRLDIDNISSNVPENINIDNPNHGDSFRIMSHMFSGSRTTNPIISVYCGGRLRAVLGEPPDQIDMTQSSSGCRGHSWRVADVTMIVDADTGFTDCNVDVLTSATGDWDLRLNSTAY